MKAPDALPALFSLAGCSAVVTGGTSGIGLMEAKGLLIAGADVTIVGRNAQTGQAKAEELCALGNCRFVAADLSSPTGVDDLAHILERDMPALSILLNNAGITYRAPFAEYPESSWDDILALNLKVPFMLIQRLTPLLRTNATADRPAHIINTGSVAGLINDTPDSFAYGPSKAGLHHMTKVLAKRFAPDHIRVNAIAPGLFPSKISEWITQDPDLNDAYANRIPARRLGLPDDIASLVIYIASSRYLTGTVIAIDGGLSL